MNKPAYAIVIASVGGLLVGAVIPMAEQLRSLALPGLFIQTLIAVGALAETNVPRHQWWPIRMLVIHHALVSAPLVVIGMAIGLDSPLGVGIFVVGAVPPAAGLPGYSAACGGQVRLMVRYCLLAYFVGIVITPALILTGLREDGHLITISLTLAIGLVLPSILGSLGRSWYLRIPRSWSFGIIAATSLVLTLGLGPDLRMALDWSGAGATTIFFAFLAAFGRCAWGAVVGGLLGTRDTRLESMMAGGFKNGVLAAVIGYSAAGPVGALPALLGVFADAMLFGLLGALAGRYGSPTSRAAALGGSLRAER